MRFVREARVGLLLACLPLSGLGCASLSPKLNVLPSIAQHRAESQSQAARDAEQRGNLVKARELYASLQRQSPNNPEYAHRMGVVCTQLQDYVTAGKYFEHARKLDGRNPTLLADMGYSFYLQKNYAGAETLLRESVALGGDDPRAVNNLAMAIGFQGRYDESLSIFRRANSETQALQNLAFIQAQRNEPESAMYTYRQILARDPGNKLATSALQLLHASQPKPVVPPSPVVEVADSAAPPEVSIRPAWDGQSLQQSAGAHEELPEPPATASDSPAGFDAPVITPRIATAIPAADVTAPAAAPPEVSTPTTETHLVSAGSESPDPEGEFQLPEKVQPPGELPGDVADAPAKPSAGKLDDLVNVFEDGEDSPEVAASDMDELTGLEWARDDLARQKTAAESASAPSASQSGHWLRGFCPVALRDERRLALAHDEFTTEFQAQTYRFSSAEARDRFLEQPESYVPVAGGLDIIEVRRGNSVTTGSLDYAVWFRRRLHLFSSAENLAAFRAAPRAFVSSP